MDQYQMFVGYLEDDMLFDMKEHELIIEHECFTFSLYFWTSRKDGSVQDSELSFDYFPTFHKQYNSSQHTNDMWTSIQFKKKNLEPIMYLNRASTNVERYDKNKDLDIMNLTMKMLQSVLEQLRNCGKQHDSHNAFQKLVQKEIKSSISIAQLSGLLNQYVSPSSNVNSR